MLNLCFLSSPLNDFSLVFIQVEILNAIMFLMFRFQFTVCVSNRVRTGKNEIIC